MMGEAFVGALFAYVVVVVAAWAVAVVAIFVWLVVGLVREAVWRWRWRH